ncbi:MAG: hypothetical protein F4Y57_05795, partial [Acidobacteria bacterium]|nr:hypothetical protein [Acidobacteriota bacterium]
DDASGVGVWVFRLRDKLGGQLTGLLARLENRVFLEKADPAVVREARLQAEDAARQQAKLEQILQELGA